MEGKVYYTLIKRMDKLFDIDCQILLSSEQDKVYTMIDNAYKENKISLDEYTHLMKLKELVI